MLSHTLEKIFLVRCRKLKSVDLCGLTSLKRFSVNWCPSVASLLFSPSTSMDELTIIGCPNLQHLVSGGPNLHLSSFTLRQVNREQLSTLLQQIQPTQLKELSVIECSDLEHFEGPVFLSFTSLRRLEIRECENLKYLPSDMSTRLLMLEEIEIYDCGLLTCLPDLRALTSLRRLVH